MPVDEAKLLKVFDFVNRVLWGVFFLASCGKLGTELVASWLLLPWLVQMGVFLGLVMCVLCW